MRSETQQPQQSEQPDPFSVIQGWQKYLLGEVTNPDQLTHDNPNLTFFPKEKPEIKSAGGKVIVGIENLKELREPLKATIRRGGSAFILEINPNLANALGVYDLYLYLQEYRKRNPGEEVLLLVLIDAQEREGAVNDLVPYAAISWAAVPFVNSVFIVPPYGLRKGLRVDEKLLQAVGIGLNLLSENPNMTAEAALAQCGTLIQVPSEASVQPPRGCLSLQSSSDRAVFYDNLMEGMDEGDINLVVGKDTRGLRENVLRFSMALAGIKVVVGPYPPYSQVDPSGFGESLRNGVSGEDSRRYLNKLLKKLRGEIFGSES